MVVLDQMQVLDKQVAAERPVAQQRPQGVERRRVSLSSFRRGTGLAPAPTERLNVRP